MEAVTLWRTGRRPLRFTGELLASARASPDRASPRWSGSTGRWVEATVYETEGGRLVLSLIRRTNWQGERDQHAVWTLGSLEEVVEVLEREEPRIAEALADELGVAEVV